MFESLTIYDFQAHHNLTLELSPLVTTVVGSSDVGKSSVFRALRWVCQNRPSGEAFLRHGKTSCWVALKVDGHTLTRRKGKGENTYTLDGQIYAALGQGGVPDVISSLLSLDGINFQGQFDGPFWFSLTPGETSRELNAVVNLDLIDSTLSNLSREVRRARTEVEVSEERLVRGKEKLASLDWTPECGEDLALLERLYISHQETIQEREGISRLVMELQIQDGLSQRLLGNLGALERDLGRLEALKNRVGKARERRESLQVLLHQVQDAEEEACQKETLATEAEEELRGMLTGRCPLCGRPPREGKDPE